MRKQLTSVVLTLLLALLVTGCETDGGVGARAKEKSAVYGSLKPWEKRNVDKGIVAVGFTPDMVYLAVGEPSKKETRTMADGRPGEVWTYRNYYPSVEAGKVRLTAFTTESTYQPATTTRQGGRDVPVGMDGNQGNSGFTTGGPQGGSGEPAALQSYTLKVLFQDGLVTRVGADPN